MNSYYPTINIGDILTKRKLLGMIEHYGVVIGHNTVLHNTPGRGEHAVTIDEFVEGQAIEVKPTGADPTVVSARGREILAKPQRYHPAKRNCQHTVFEAIYGVAKSPTATLLLFFALLAVVFGVLISLRKR
jgi:hypothetical protein